ncbi:hypothetical protein [Paludibacter sp.]|uniref:hypothetical protein n=1 Tax=Paludibacter sp. TaxID=1898105 RepID=UPI001353D5D3|nr:hypothetical protein [Paludibacter sp.]MTK53136.1 hypothetical protein [Paludibacter sp.]
MNKTHYFRTLICIIVAGCLSVSAYAKTKLVAQSQYCADFASVTPPDSSTMFASFADGKVLIRAFNNPTGFFIQLVAADEQTQQKLLFNGMTVYVDPTGKEKDKYAVIFPSMMSLRQQTGQAGMNQEETRPQPQDAGQEQGNQSQQRGPRRPDPSKMAQQINLKGATFDIDGDSRAVGIEWVKLTITPNQKICYNIKLPYSVFNLKNSSSEFLSIGLLSEFSLPQGMQSGGGMGGPGGGMGGPGGGMGGPGGGMGGPGGGMGGPGGGMGGPGGMGQNSGNARSMFAEMGKPVKGWIQTKLDAAH